LTASLVAQQFDTGWKIVASEALSDLEFTGAGLRINNFVISQYEEPKNGSKLTQFTFSAAALKKTVGKRSVLVEIVGFKEDKTPTISSILAINIYDETANKLTTGEHRFLAYPSEVQDTRTYVIRVLVP
jgi:hypothetical protein